MMLRMLSMTSIIDPSMVAESGLSSLMRIQLEAQEEEAEVGLEMRRERSFLTVVIVKVTRASFLVASAPELLGRI